MLRQIIRTCCLLSISAIAISTPAFADRFSFVALGDTAYNDEPDYPIYDALIQRINKTKPSFTIHIGDVWGGSECLEKDHLAILDWFSRYEHPLIYTPGDNEWTDCIDPKVITAFWRIHYERPEPGDDKIVADYRSTAAKINRSYKWALASLKRIRRLYFQEPYSLGQTKLPLTRQSTNSKNYKWMVENARWAKDEVVFATVHVVGSSNGFSIASDDAAKESIQRNRANIEWLTAAFDEANKTKAKAVVIAMHGAFFDQTPATNKATGKQILGGKRGPYGAIALAIKELGEKFGKPVLLIHGDQHEFVIDRPFLVSKGESELPTGGNITRMQVYGAPELRAVKIDVDTDTPWIFSFSPLYDQ